MHVSGLYYYPIKSCAGISLNNADINQRGILFDRNWLIVDQQGKFITQRQNKRMALIKPEVLDNELLKLSAEKYGSVTSSGSNDAKDILEVLIWKDKCLAFDEGKPAAEWLSNYLETPCKLVRMCEDFKRNAIAKNEKSKGVVGFADAYPFLIISEASLNDLNSRLDESLPMNRFRPNIVIADCEAYAEDKWQQIVINNVNLDAAGGCSRCVITTINQETIERGKEPLSMLATYRQSDEGVMFGQNYINSNEGAISLGDKVLVKT